MDATLIKTIQQVFINKEVPMIRTGMEVEISQSFKDGAKERVQKFKGLVIKTAGKTALEKTITVRKDIDGIGVEKVFTVASPSIVKIDILRQFKVRRKHIGFIRNLRGKAARLKEVKPTNKVSA